jgi:magnesium-transporting ATPase (P-type)
MGVGDGYNDIGMLRKVDVSVQLYNSEVPLVFGDILVPNLMLINKLLFCQGKKFATNFMMIVYLNLVSILPLNIFHFIYQFDSNFTGVLFKDYEILLYMIGTNLIMIYIGYNCFPYKNPVLIKFTETYSEVKLYSNYFWRLIGAASFIMYIQSVYSYSSVKRYLATCVYTANGQKSSNDSIGLVLLIVNSVLFLFRAYFFSFDKGNTILIFALAVFITVVLIIVLVNIANPDAFDSNYLIFLFRQRSFYYTLIDSTVIPVLLDYIFITGMIANFIYPAYNLIVSKYLSKDLNFFLTNGRGKIMHLLKFKDDFSLSRIVKSVYKGFSSMDIEDNVKKILSMDSNNFNLGIN